MDPLLPPHSSSSQKISHILRYLNSLPIKTEEKSSPYTSTLLSSTISPFALSSPLQRSDLDHGINSMDNKQINGNTISPLSYIEDYDTHWTNSSISYIQAPIMSENSMASPEWIESRITFPRGNGRPEHLSQSGSRIVSADYGYDQGTLIPHDGTHRYLGFGTSHAYENTNYLGTFSSSHVPSNLVAHSSMNQPTTNYVQMNSNSQQWRPVHERTTDLTVAGENSHLLNNKHPKNQNFVTTNLTHSHSIDGVEPISGPIQVSPIEQQMVPYIESVSPRLTTNVVEELNQERPRKRRKIASDKDGKGKCCTCKKSQCLKLYCECFASQSHCSNSCTCQNCGNTSANNETVLDMRKKVETRNRNAFAPNVTREGIEYPINRKGCNCKNSKCEQKYCECFQGNVGCSLDLCRCENCQNRFGRRPEAKFYMAQNLVLPPNGSVNTNSTGEIHSNNYGSVNTNQFPLADDRHDISHHNPSLPLHAIPLTSLQMDSWDNSPSDFQPLAASSPHLNPSPGRIIVFPQSPDSGASCSLYGLVQDVIVTEEIAPEETSHPSNIVQPSSPKPESCSIASATRT